MIEDRKGLSADERAASESDSVELGRGRFPRFLKAAIGPEWFLAVATALLIVDHAGVALAPEDAEPAETPLVMSIARQAVAGPGGLYGPFSANNPLVLIHAPLYYRIAACAAWVWTSTFHGDPVVAALIAGRSLSIASFLILLAAIARLSTLDGLSPRAGVWSVLFLAATPLIADFAVPCRADLFAIAAQTLGATLLLQARQRGSDRGWFVGFLALAVAFCAKQHAVGSALVLVGLLSLDVARGRLRFRPIAIGAISAAVFAIVYLLGEEFASSAQMINAVFRLPGRFARLNPAGWGYVLIVLAEIAARSPGILAASALGIFISKSFEYDRRLDRALWFLTGVELTLTIFLCRNNDGGAWINYGLQPIVYLGAIAGRLFAKIELTRGPWVRNLTFIVAGCVFALNYRLVTVSERIVRERERASLRLILNDRFQVPSRSARERYFVGRQGLNRLFGNRALIHDEWLYTWFERVLEAEPRDRWLTRALARGPILQVITVREPSQRVPGVEPSLQALGFHPVAALGPYKVWDKGPSRRTHRSFSTQR